MKRTLKAMGLTLILSAPITLGQIALAQVIVDPIPQVRQHSQTRSAEAVFNRAMALNEAPLTVAQNYSQEEEFRAFQKSDYTYWDAAVLASFWNQEVLEAKSRIGRKVLWSGNDQSALSMMLVDARVKALGTVDALNLYSQSDFTYDDAAALAEYWGDASPYESKLRIERNLVLGNEQAIHQMLKLTDR